MPRSPREYVRTAVGLAVVAPAVGLLVLAVILMRDGGTSGVLAGLFVAVLAVGLLGVALMMTHAPVTISNLLEDEDDQPSDAGGPNGGPEPGEEPDQRDDRVRP